ncbi:phycoerythrin alpha subunit 6 [Guillardia theta CCMP2712]|uniref:Phycoerythrin alpha subunit 6 n=1 Tax=Guillardia theta (strain CCMP2712) TaxID=905079 RepID=L1JGF5_GUITC|nr:phycoerythrin alpha subunit 6 [Guillardia theta CCMP2712]EKX47392.1 phycoerythrin alpha subunit 6 [Guillardia theta CCMP2712]|eukprot:XP_005834372.1 phycoerythrin alpha subunit 6 [Guillardia theta CCMP2712]
MLAKLTLAAASVAAASAFSAGPALPLRAPAARATSVSMVAESDVSRRSVLGGAAIAGAAALTAPKFAEARDTAGAEKGFLAPQSYQSYRKGQLLNIAPVLTRVLSIDPGPRRAWLPPPRAEYTGAKVGTEDDAMCVSVKAKAIPANTNLAASILSDFQIYCQDGSCPK